MKKLKRPGAPTKFTEAIAQRIIDLAKEGKTDVEIAKTVGIGTRTLGLWKLRHNGFRDLIENAKTIADESVEHSLFMRATGYTYRASKIHYDERRGQFASIEYDEHCPPDVNAIKFYLENRRKNRWKANQPQEHRITLEMIIAQSRAKPAPVEVTVEQPKAIEPKPESPPLPDAQPKPPEPAPVDPNKPW